MAWNVKNEMPTGRRICEQRRVQAEADGVGGVGERVDEEAEVLEEPEQAEVHDHRRPHQVQRSRGPLAVGPERAVTARPNAQFTTIVPTSSATNRASVQP